MKPNIIIDNWQTRVDRVRKLKQQITTENKLVQANYIINTLNKRIQGRYKPQ